MPSTKPNMIDALRAKHDPHYQLAGKVERLEKDIPIQLSQLHKTLSKSFGMQRKTLVRVLGLEGKVSELESHQAAEEQAQSGIDDLLKDIHQEKAAAGEDEEFDAAHATPEEVEEYNSSVPMTDEEKEFVGEKSKFDAVDESVATKKKPKKKKKRPPIKVKKRKISPKDLAKGTPFDPGFKSRVMGEDEKGEYLSKEERKKRFKLGDKQEKDGLSKTVEDVSQSSQQPTSPLDSVIGVVNSIAASVDSIRETLIGQQKVSQEQVSEQREQQQQKKRGMKEKALEAGGKIMGGAKKVGEKILAPVKGLWTKLMDFLIGILLGKAVISLFEWFTDPANTDKVSSLFKFLKDWWPVLLASIMAFVPALLGPGGFIIGTIALLAWGIPKIVNIVKSIFGFGKSVDKELKNVESDAKKTGEDLGKNIENDADKLGGDAPETGDPEKSPQPAELGDVDKSQKDLQNIKQPQGMKEGGPVESKEGGKVEGEKGVDKVPAMLTEGEFVLSKGAVQAYGVDTLAAMNAAAGGTNKPTEKDGKAAYAGGGPVGNVQTMSKQLGHTGGTVTDPKEKARIEAETLHWVNKERVEYLGLPPLDKISYADGVELTKPMGKEFYGAGITEESSDDMNFDTMTRTTTRWKQRGSEIIFEGAEERITEEQKQAYLDSNPEARMAMELKDQAEMDDLGASISASAKMNGGGLVPAFNFGGFVQALPNMLTLSDGGNVTGSGNKDTVPAMLTPGEFVMNKVSTAKIGIQNLMKMNANMGKTIFGGLKDKMGDVMGDKGGNEDKIIGVAVADIPKGSPLMKSAKAPAGDAIKPPMKSSGKGGVQVDKSLTTGLGGGQGMAGAGGGKMLPLMDPAKKISASKIAVMGITV